MDNGNSGGSPDQGNVARSHNEKAADTFEESPEGGFAGWATVVGAFLVQFCAFGYTTSYGVYQDFYTREYVKDASPSTISWIGSVNAFLVLSSGLIAGRLYDQGNFYPLQYGGSFILAFSLFMLSLAEPNQFYQLFLSQGLGAGLGAGILYVPSFAILSQHFRTRRALAMTIVSSGAPLGAVLLPIMLNYTLTDLGFANASRAVAALITGLLFISCLLMRTRSPVTRDPPHLGESLKRFARDGPYVAATIGTTISVLALYYPLFYLQLDATTHGLSETSTFYSLVILNFSSFVGRLCCAVFAHKTGVENAVVVSTGFCSVMLFAMVGLKSFASVVIIGIIYGFFAGVYIAVTAPLIAVLTLDMTELGSRMGVTYAVAGVGGLIGPPIDGALLGHDFQWWRPGIFNGIMFLLGCSSFLIMLFLLSRQNRNRLADLTSA